VQKLCMSLNNLHCIVVFDNFFLSCELLETLYSQNIYAVATVRSNRQDLPVIARDRSALNKGEFEWRTKNTTAYMKWKDTKDVHIISTAFSPSETRHVNRTQKDGSTIQVSCPEAVVEYTKRIDEKRGRYSVTRRSSLGG